MKQLVTETVEKLIEETGKIAESVITAKELLGDIKPMSDEELEKKKAEDQKKKQEEAVRLRQGFGGQGRNIENEMEKIRQEKEREEEEREKYFEQMKKQKEEEKRQQEEEYGGLNMESSNPAKQKKSRGSAFIMKKKQQPTQSQMSQTSEFKGKID